MSGRSDHAKNPSVSSRIAIGIGAAALTLAQQSNQPRPTCHRCQATYVPVSELLAFTAKAAKYGIVDQQVRSVDVGKSQVGVAMVTRGKLVAGIASKGAVAEHEQVHRHRRYCHAAYRSGPRQCEEEAGFREDCPPPEWSRLELRFDCKPASP